MDATANGNMDAAANGNNANQGDPPNQDNIPPPTLNGNEQPPAQPLAQPPALPPVLQRINGDLGRALQVLQLQQQVFQQQQQEIAQQHQQQIAYLTRMINELTTHVAQVQNVPNVPGGPLQNGPSTSSPNYVQPLIGALPAAAPPRNGGFQGSTPLGQSNNVDPLSSNLTPTFPQPPNHVQSQPARGIRQGTTSNTSVPSSDQSPNHVRINDDYDYAFNREKRETSCESIDIEEFSMSNKEQDFTIWITQFEDAVNRGFNPHSRRRHQNYCLQWIPGSLSTDAFSIWQES